MPPNETTLSPTVVIAAAREILSSNGFQIAGDLGLTALHLDRSLIAEDEYSILAIIVYDTWSELEAEWSDAQSELVGLLAGRLAKTAPKAWDAYLVLCCAAPASGSAARSIIERDTTRVRKIVATGEALRTTGDVLNVLDAFLPLRGPGVGAEASDVLATLPDLLKGEVPVSATQA